MSAFNGPDPMQQPSNTLAPNAVFLDTSLVDRPRKNRAAKACTSCRERKIRCDVSSAGLPCSNCSVNHRHCLTKERVRKRRADRPVYLATPFGEVHSFPVQLPKASHYAPQAPISTSEGSSIVSNPLLTQLVAPLDTHGFQINSKRTSSCPNPAFIPDNLEHHNFGHDGCLDVSNSGLSHTRGEKHASIENMFEFMNQSLNSQPYRLHKESYPESEIVYSYYGFLKSHTVSHLPIEDVQFLEQLKCFSAPIRPILDEIIRSYFLHVQPHFPIFDEATFWTSYNSDCNETPSKDRMSLFTFQAFLCVACSFSDLSTLRLLRLNGPRQGRNVYYRRAKNLFDLGIETDSLAISQGALLLTYFTPKTDSTANSYWLGVAIEHARRIRAHEYQSLPDVSSSHRAQLKRLWWCCILRDTTLSLGLRRPLHIPWNSANEHLSLLNQKDFEDEINYSAVYDSATKRSLVELLSLFCEFSLCLLEVLELLYPRWKATPTATICDGVSEARQRRLRACESKIEKWYQKASDSQHAAFNRPSNEKSLILLKNLIRMAYHSAKVAIYNDAILETTTDPIDGEFALSPWSSHGVLLEQEVIGITRCLMEVLKANLISGLPVSVVAFAALPLVWYVMGSKLAAATQDTSTLQDCVHAYTKTMKACQSIYEGADAVVENVAKLMKHIRLKPSGSSSNSELEISNSRHQHQSQPKRHACLGTIAQRGVGGWIGLLLSQPSLYASIITTIDISLSSGHYPKFTDLPVALQMAQADGMFPLCVSLSLNPAHTSSSAADQCNHACDASWDDPQTPTVEQNGTYTLAQLDISDLVSTVACNQPQSLIALHDSDSIPQRTWAEMHVLQQMLQGYGEVGMNG